MQKGPQLVSLFPATSLMFSHIQCNLTKQGMAIYVQVQGPSNSCLFITHHGNIMQTTFQLVIILTPFGKITTEHKRSRYYPIPLSESVYNSSKIIHYSGQLIMTCIGYANINRPSQDCYTTLYLLVIKRSVAVIAIP